MKSLTFNGIRKTWLYLLQGRQKAPFAPIARNLLRIPGRPGAILQSSETEPLIIYQPIGFLVKDDADALAKKDELASWLVTDDPVPLEFDDEPERTYYAVVQNTITDFEQFVNQRRGTIEFLVLDGYGYGPEQYTEFESSATFKVNGTVETKPIIEIRMKDKSTFVAVSNGESLNMIGNYASVDQPPFEPTTLVLHDGMGSMVGWTSTTSIEEGENTGSIATSGDSFYVADFGVGSQWHGPALKRSIGATLQDFELEAEISFDGEKGQVGSIEIALLDVNNRFVAKLLFTKRVSERLKNYVRAQVGPYDVGVRDITFGALNERWDWEPFDGKLRISRLGNRWSVSVMQANRNGPSIVYYPSVSTTWNDWAGNFTTPVTQVQVQFWAFSTVQTPEDMRIKDIKIYRINSNPNGTPYIANAGDIVIFDHMNENILRNGESIIKHKAFIGDYFKLNPGLNTIVVEPENAVESVMVRWRTKWL